MKILNPNLFNALRNTSQRIDVGWLIVRTDGARYGFTSSDQPFTYNGDTYSPTNGFNSSAVVSKNDASVDNMEVQVLEHDTITEPDLLAGVWSNAAVNIFWIVPSHPEWGVVPLRGGILGQVELKEGVWTTQLRSLMQQLQQPFGYLFQLTCNSELGDGQCGVMLDAPVWTPNTQYALGSLDDAKLGTVVKPSDPNSDFWYVAQYSVSTTYPIQQPSQPAQGLSANDDAGPNDTTQVAVGAAPSDLSQFDYQGDPVDIFGIKL